MGRRHLSYRVERMVTSRSVRCGDGWTAVCKERGCDVKRSVMGGRWQGWMKGWASFGVESLFKPARARCSVRAVRSQSWTIASLHPHATSFLHRLR